ncbi:5-(carboxyamino)imidazole ribonucleotide synthase [Anoxybacillus ayderensis]|uniref:N5-carboxyaminoimidazole ribonucleotide synthase n=1 Tax=Anoxybacillus ayderensis TaxID=265546 RepID=A0A0D0HQE0_9BACL|nr:5-(carboxyamino)imidazole ribonucleotide synthase [Anoxybacillus ayderensis]EPZ38182.1 phosphoribosylaminoimidazole carboxylase ATPase subunit [Anoxybacillus ayderensis]KIP20098.1 N5-carboxyaminoimidazole ribonucleotide synthase [Anoxybacillus ayderensis]NNU97213.1 5-(carboxyamino)imidazole ribonucleotide synthase [Anoxybacillus sp. EFIL]
MISLNKTIVPGQTIGIIGGGQLGRMMAIAAKEMGFFVAVLDPTPQSPCAQVADIEIVASYSDEEALHQLAEISDVVTYEFENIDADALKRLAKKGYVPQGSELLAMTQHRWKEKRAVQSVGLPVAPYRLVLKEEELEEAIQEIGIPSVLKTCRGGYDGKGQVVIRCLNDIGTARSLLTYGECVLEAWIPFVKELSIIVARNVSGEMALFPVVENIHRDNILHETIAPAQVSRSIIEQAETYAKQLAGAFQLVGTLAIEMFLTKDGQLYVNELAPRPHNSGHYTINGCITSQFQQHIRAVCNWPLGSTKLLKPSIMVNILGEHVDDVIRNIDQFRDAHVHFYGKKEAKPKRKMGHITWLVDDVDEVQRKIDEFAIWTDRRMNV